jgi:hypothetical protein
MTKTRMKQVCILNVLNKVKVQPSFVLYIVMIFYFLNTRISAQQYQRLGTF